MIFYRLPFLLLVFLYCMNFVCAETLKTQERDPKLISIKQSEIYQVLDNIPEVLDNITISPHYSNGECLGLAVSDLGSIKLASKMQIKEGDIIKSLDGVPLNDISEIFAYYAGKDIAEVKQGRKFTLVLIRHNQVKTMKYIIS